MIYFKHNKTGKTFACERKSAVFDRASKDKETYTQVEKPKK